LDRTQRAWAWASLGILAVSAIAYTVYERQDPNGPRSGSTMGLIFGASGFAFMIFAALLGP
jgi:hypothetical protein